MISEDNKVEVIPNCRKSYMKFHLSIKSGAAKVTCFNKLLIEGLMPRLLTSTNYSTVLGAVPAEFKYYHHNGLHLSDLALTKQCSIIFSNLYKALAPANYKQRKESRPACSAPHRINASSVQFSSFYFTNLKNTKEDTFTIKMYNTSRKKERKRQTVNYYKNQI